MKKAHIISHTHWDREWYLPYERHHMLLVEFMDVLIETLEKDKDFRSFHLDGHTLPIEDYLQVKPDMKDRLVALIKQERIVVGPWFILQDEFLTSSEANIRNLQMGHEMSVKYGGKPCKIGYFPDSFGNIGQAPQILKKAGIDSAVFGRGVKPTGFNNTVSDSNYESPYSEMFWQSEDGSKVLAVLFANWYSNGIEIPVDEEESKKYWENRLANAEKYASTDHLLFMNGCDHQPVQTDLSQAIKLANELHDDVEFISSNFVDYLAELRGTVPDDMKTVEGELRSQQTNGWYTLANTASARIYLKQMNAKCQMMFEKIAEPIATIAAKYGKPYPTEVINYGWRTLMENHPHDSICGCSVDEVHRENVARFEKAEQVAHYVIDESLDFLKKQVDTSCFEAIDKKAKPFMVWNTSPIEKTGVYETIIEVEKKYFREGPLHKIMQEMKDMKLPSYKVIDANGNEIKATVTEENYQFNYDLPKDKFRQPYMAKRVKVSMEVNDIKAFSMKSFALIEGTATTVSDIKVNGTQIETKHLKADFDQDGSFTLTNKSNGKSMTDLGVFEDCGDIGNEYIFFQPKGEKDITTKGVKAEINVVENTGFRAVVEVKHTMMLPKQADDEVLNVEMIDIVEFKHRKAQRVSELVEFKLVAKYIFDNEAKEIKVETEFDNNVLDHRVRATFNTGITTDVHFADSIFEVAKRDRVPHAEWVNPSNAQHMQNFIAVNGDDTGLVVAGKGINEYEVMPDNTIAITIHRGTRELGDWGYFPTPEAQCLGQRKVEYAIIMHEGDAVPAYRNAYAYQVDLVSELTEIQSGSISANYSFVEFEGDSLIGSSLKMTEGKAMYRFYNITMQDSVLKLPKEYTIHEYDILEKLQLGKKDSNEINVGKKEIITINIEQ